MRLLKPDLRSQQEKWIPYFCNYSENTLKNFYAREDLSTKPAYLSALTRQSLTNPARPRYAPNRPPGNAGPTPQVEY